MTTADHADTDRPEAALTERIIGVFFEVYNELGAGFLEVVYRRAMALALHDAGLMVEAERAFDIRYRGVVIGHYRADLLVAGRVVVELKSAERLVAAHEAQLLNYLRVTGLPVGLLLNFGPKPEIRRKANTRAGQSASSPYKSAPSE